MKQSVRIRLILRRVPMKPKRSKIIQANTIDDEVLRSRIRKLIEKPKDASLWNRLSTNPLISVIPGFALTGVIGAYLTNYYNEKQKELEHLRNTQQKELDRTRDEQQRTLENDRNHQQKELEYLRDQRQRELERERAERQKELEFEKNKQQQLLDFSRDVRQRNFERERAQQQANYAASTKAIQDFSKLMYERQTRSMLLYSSFNRNAPIEEVRERKKEYDRTFVDWGAQHQANLLMIRNAVKAKTYSDFEGVIEFGLVPIFRRIDACLTESYDARIRDESVAPILERCQVSEELRLSIDCSYAITDELFRFITFEHYAPKGRGNTVEDISINRIQNQCGY